MFALALCGLPGLAQASDFGRVALEAFLGIGSTALYVQAAAFALAAMIRSTAREVVSQLTAVFGVSLFFSAWLGAIVLSNLQRIHRDQAIVFAAGLVAAIATWSWMHLRHPRPPPAHGDGDVA